MFDLPSTDGGWGAILIDPPWSFSDTGSRLAPEGSVSGYETLPDAAILALPVKEIAAPNAHLYLWTTDAHIELALRCAKRWGFRYVQLIHWLKVDAQGRPMLGGGHYFRHVTESLLFCVRGKAPFPRHDLGALIVAPRQAHSQKPRKIHRLIEQASPSPRLEVFARAPVEGWTVWGAQAEKGIGAEREPAPDFEPALSVHGQFSLFAPPESDLTRD